MLAVVVVMAEVVVNAATAAADAIDGKHNEVISFKMAYVIVKLNRSQNTPNIPIKVSISANMNDGNRGSSKDHSDCT